MRQAAPDYAGASVLKCVYSSGNFILGFLQNGIHIISNNIQCLPCDKVSVFNSEKAFKQTLHIFKSEIIIANWCACRCNISKALRMTLPRRNAFRAVNKRKPRYRTPLQPDFSRLQETANPSKVPRLQHNRLQPAASHGGTSDLQNHFCRFFRHAGEELLHPAHPVFRYQIKFLDFPGLAFFFHSCFKLL